MPPILHTSISSSSLAASPSGSIPEGDDSIFRFKYSGHAVVRGILRRVKNAHHLITGCTSSSRVTGIQKTVQTQMQ